MIRMQTMLSGKPHSYWMASTPETSYPALQNNDSADACVVGAGLTGLTTAYLLQQEGLDVVCLDRAPIVTKVTGHTTAKVTAFHDLTYKNLIHSFNEEDARLYHESNDAAIGTLERIVQRESIDCDFARKDLYLFTKHEDDARLIREEYKAFERLGIPGELTDHTGLPIPAAAALRVSDQAQFHPRKFLLELAEHFVKRGGRIYEHSLATKVAPGKEVTTTVNAHTVTAPFLVVASHYPFYDGGGLYNTRLSPSTSYGLAIRITTEFPNAMYIGIGEDEYTYRSQPDPGGEVVIIGGEDHPTGKDTTERFARMIASAQETFPVTGVANAWSTHDMMTLDGIPYIGYIGPRHKNIFVATGFAKWGMTKAVLSAMLLTDLIQGRENPWSAFYTPQRITKESVPSAVQKVTGVVSSLVKPILQKKEDSIDEVLPGEGRVLEIHGQKVALYRDDQGKTTMLKASCTHMGCTVQWNVTEQRWDCPCHGSQFLKDGSVNYGPALSNLPKATT